MVQHIEDMGDCPSIQTRAVLDIASRLATLEATRGLCPHCEKPLVCSNRICTGKALPDLDETTCLIDDIQHKASLLKIAEQALEDIRGLCISSTYWNNTEFPNCARMLRHHHKVVTDAQAKIKAHILAAKNPKEVITAYKNPPKTKEIG